MASQHHDTTDAATLAERQWCAVHTRYQHEQQVNELLAAKGFETFLPTYQKLHAWKDRKKKITHALFPGYLFVADLQDRRLHVVATPGVCAIVSVGGVPAAIPDHEIDAVRRAVSSSHDVCPHAYLRKGDFVCVREGPLAGIKGILVRTEKLTRLVLSIKLLGRAVAVELDGSCVEALTAPPAGGQGSEVGVCRVGMVESLKSV